MAGAFTHMAVVVEAMEAFPVGTTLGNILRKNRQFLTLGSVSPDIPYLGHLAFAGGTWADIMHYYNTNGIVNNAVHSLSAANVKNDTWKCQYAWLLGFVSHLVADATIHPIVESIVGPYTNPNNVDNHRECEMVQDVMIIHEIMNIDIGNAEYTNLLHDSFKHPSFKKVAEFWSTHAEVNCPFVGEFDTEKIIESYKMELDTADGGNILARAFRHFGSTFAYRTIDDLRENSDDLVERYYRKVKLPNDQTGSFKTFGFEHTVKNLISVWSRIHGYIFSKDNITSIVPNWNLDTGVDQSTLARTYWS